MDSARSFTKRRSNSGSEPDFRTVEDEMATAEGMAAAMMRFLAQEERMVLENDMFEFEY